MTRFWHSAGLTGWLAVVLMSSCQRAGLPPAAFTAAPTTASAVQETVYPGPAPFQPYDPYPLVGVFPTPYRLAPVPFQPVPWPTVTPTLPPVPVIGTGRFPPLIVQFQAQGGQPILYQVQGASAEPLALPDAVNPCSQVWRSPQGGYLGCLRAPDLLRVFDLKRQAWIFAERSRGTWDTASLGDKTGPYEAMTSFAWVNETEFVYSRVTSRLRRPTGTPAPTPDLPALEGTIYRRKIEGDTSLPVAEYGPALVRRVLGVGRDGKSLYVTRPMAEDSGLNLEGFGRYEVESGTVQPLWPSGWFDPPTARGFQLLPWAQGGVRVFFIARSEQEAGETYWLGNPDTQTARPLGTTGGAPQGRLGRAVWRAGSSSQFVYPRVEAGQVRLVQVDLESGRETALPFLGWQALAWEREGLILAKGGDLLLVGRQGQVVGEVVFGAGVLSGLD